MIIHTMEQGSDEWFKVRSGVPTASRFKDIFTSTGKASASQEKYINELVAETISLRPLESFTSEWMTRGTELEPEARTYYELETGNSVTEVGFATLDLRAGVIGGSPDGLIMDGERIVSGIEIKCPSPAKHVEYLRKGKCPAEYYPQVQGLMLIFHTKTWDFMSYHPDLEKQLIVTVERDEKWQNGFFLEIDKFNEKLTKAIKEIA